MKSLVNVLSRIVRKAPWIVIISTVLVSMALGAFSAQFLPAEDQNEAFAPEAEELSAQERIGEFFGSSVSVMQVLVKSPSGDVITTDALSAVTAVETAIRSSDLAQFLTDRPDSSAVVSYLAPVQSALAQGAPVPASDAEVKALFTNSFEQAPPQQQGFMRLLLPSNSDVGSASSDVGMLIVSYSASDNFDVAAKRAQIAADAVSGVALPGDLEVEPFNLELIFANQDDFSAEIGRLFLAAGFIIITVLAAVYLLRPEGSRLRAITLLGFVGLVGTIILVTLPSLAAIFPDTFPASIAGWDTGPIALTAAGVVALVFAIWGFSAGRLRRTVADILITLATIFFAISWMNGIGYFIFGEQGPMTQILPILLIGLGVDYAIHLTSRYREEVSQSGSVDGSISKAIRTVGVALALATVTTSVGFLTNVFNEIPALREFGLLAAVGIIASFILALTFVPAVRLLLDRRAEREGRLDTHALVGNASRALPRIIGSTAVLAKRFAVPMVIVSLLLGGLGAWATFTQLEAKFDFLDFVPTTSPIRATAVELGERFEFPETTNVLIEGDDIATPAAWNAMAVGLAKLADVDNVVSVGGQAFANSPHAIVGQLANPESPTFVPEMGAAAQAAGFGPDLTVSSDADVSALLDTAYGITPEAMSSVIHRDDSGTYDASLIGIQTQAGADGVADLRTDLASAFSSVSDTDLTAVGTSNAIINDVVVTSLRDSQVSSLLLTLGAALLLLVLNFWIEVKRPFLGVITTIPVGLVVLLAFGIMALAGIPFGPVTATIAALAIGIGIPYMIHITHRYEEDRSRIEDADEAITNTLTFTGGALAGSAITTIAGFGILVVSSTIPFRQFGFVTSYTIALALLAAVLFLPSYLYLWDRWHRRRGHEPIDEEALRRALGNGDNGVQA